MVNFRGTDHNGLMLLVAVQVSYLKAGDEKGGKEKEEDGVETLKQITQRLNFTRKQCNSIWTL